MVDQPTPGAGPNGSGGQRGDPQNKLLAYVDDLHLHFETERGTVEALDGVNFEVNEGELLALVGETGCGKTVTARSFMQLVPTPPGQYAQGTVRMRSENTCTICDGNGCETCRDTGVEFEDLLGMSTKEMEAVRGERISMIFQDPESALNPSLTIRSHLRESILAHQGQEVLSEAGIDVAAMGQPVKALVEDYASADNSTFFSYLMSVPPLRKHKSEIRRIVRKRSVDLLNETQIANPAEVLDVYPHELSGGQQQRVMIAMALAPEPDLLIADEPTTALDVTTQSRILDLLKDLMKESNTGLLYITHDLNLVRDIADRVAVMYAGEIAEMGDVNRVYDNPLHPYTKGLINSIPSEERVGRRLQEIEGTVPDLTRPPDGCRFCTRCPEELEHCRDIDPPIREEEENHEVRCHLYVTEEASTVQADPAEQQSDTVSAEQ